MTTQPATPPPVDVADVVPQARHLHPTELAQGDLLFDPSGALQPIAETAVLRDGKIVSALLTNRHRVWFWNDEPIVAVLPRTDAPTITVYERVFDPGDEIGWANGDPRVIDTETSVFTWEPDDGSPIGWALGILDRNGTSEPSSSPPFTERTSYSGTGVDFARSGATVDTSAHLSGFTRAEVEQIGIRVTAPRPRRHDGTAGRAFSCQPHDATRALMQARGGHGR